MIIPEEVFAKLLRKPQDRTAVDRRGVMANILIIEDDQRLRELIAETLAGRGHTVQTSSLAMEGLRLAVDREFSLVVLDLGLPDLDGFDLLKMIRSVDAVPIIVVTARSDPDEIVRTLEAGADDYLVKPFSALELSARAAAVLRRGAPPATIDTIRVGGLEIDPGARVVQLDGRTVDLSPKEFDLLWLLARRAGQVVSKREILAEVWREPVGGREKSVDVHLSWLRKKLGETAREPRYLHSVFGVGIKLVEPES